MMDNQQFWKARIREGSVLSPVDRISEVLFGLIMVLTFTGAISAATSQRDEVKELLWAALGCNIAWGIVDAIMYLMNVMVERGHGAQVVKKLDQSGSNEELRQILRNEIAPTLSHMLSDEELDGIGERLKKLPPPEMSSLFVWRDLIAGLEIFLLVFLCTLPVALPFALMDELALAMRVSNGIALFLLAVGGYILAGYAGFRKIPTAIAYALIGILLVALTMALGG